TCPGNAVDVSGYGTASVPGATTAGAFPVTGGPGLTFKGGASDAFVAKVNAAGTGLVYCGYIGGSANDSAQGVAVDSAGNAYVTGYTASDQTSFPVTVGPDLTFNGPLNGNDAFVAKVNATSPYGLVYCGYIG